jgi:hypothetical protein
MYPLDVEIERMALEQKLAAVEERIMVLETISVE